MLPTLVYRLDVILPEQKLMDMLERTNKKFLIHILSLPITTSDSALYVLIEGVIHKRALSLYGNVCRIQSDKAVDSKDSQ